MIVFIFNTCFETYSAFRILQKHTNVQYTGYRSYIYAAFLFFCCQDLIIVCNVTPHLNPEVPVAITPLQCCTCLRLLTDHSRLQIETNIGHGERCVHLICVDTGGKVFFHQEVKLSC